MFATAAAIAALCALRFLPILRDCLSFNLFEASWVILLTGHCAVFICRIKRWRPHTRYKTELRRLHVIQAAMQSSPDRLMICRLAERWGILRSIHRPADRRPDHQWLGPSFARACRRQVFQARGRLHRQGRCLAKNRQDQCRAIVLLAYRAPAPPLERHLARVAAWPDSPLMCAHAPPGHRADLASVPDAIAWPVPAGGAWAESLPASRGRFPPSQPAEQAGAAGFASRADRADAAIADSVAACSP